MTSLIILILVLGIGYILRAVGLLKNLRFSWDLIFRWYLYILLILGGLGVLAKVWSIFVIIAHLPMSLLISPSQNLPIDVVSTIVYAIALWGVWQRKKWGAYLIFLRLAFTIFVQIVIYHSLGWQLAAGYTGLDNLYADFTGGITWLIAFYFTWKYFK